MQDTQEQLVVRYCGTPGKAEQLIPLILILRGELDPPPERSEQHDEIRCLLSHRHPCNSY